LSSQSRSGSQEDPAIYEDAPDLIALTLLVDDLPIRVLHHHPTNLLRSITELKCARIPAVDGGDT
jgi:hypothetical protein